MHFYVGAAALQPAEWVTFARRAEELGFSGVSVPDHVFMPAEMSSKYPYWRDGRFPQRPTAPWPDVWALLGALAVSTSRLRLRTGIYLLPLRHPIHVARAAGTAAILSEGRLELGIGVGWMAEEFEGLGVDYRRRGALVDEAIGVLRALWSPGPTRHAGAHWRFGPLHLEPVPPSPIPILIGGKADAAVRRAARVGDGYIMNNGTIVNAIELTRRLRELLADEGRAGEPFAIHATASDARTVDDFARLLDHGIDIVTVFPFNEQPDDPFDVQLAGMETFARVIVEPLATAAVDAS